MPAPGIGQQTVWGFGKETTYGTAVTPNRFHPISGEGQELKIEYVEDDAMQPNTYNASLGARRAEAARHAEGDVNMTVVNKGMGLLLEQIFGTDGVVTSLGGSPVAYQHVFALGLLNKSMTTQKQIRDNSANVLGTFTHPGTKVTKATFTIGAKNLLKLALTLFSQDEKSDISAASASYISAAPFAFKQGFIKFNGTNIADTVKDAEISLERPLDTEAYGLNNGGLASEPAENDMAKIGGSLTSRFENIATFYDRYKANTALALVLLFEGTTISGSNKFSFKLEIPEIRLDGETPKVGGPSTVEHKIPFTGFANGTDAGITATVITTDAAV